MTTPSSARPRARQIRSDGWLRGEMIEKSSASCSLACLLGLGLGLGIGFGLGVVSGSGLGFEQLGLPGLAVPEVEEREERADALPPLVLLQPHLDRGGELAELPLANAAQLLPLQ